MVVTSGILDMERGGRCRRSSPLAGSARRPLSFPWLGGNKVLADSQVYTLYSVHAKYGRPTGEIAIPVASLALSGGPIRVNPFNPKTIPAFSGAVMSCRIRDPRRSTSMARGSMWRPESRRFGRIGVSLPDHASVRSHGCSTDQVARLQSLDFLVWSPLGSSSRLLSSVPSLHEPGERCHNPQKD